MGADTFQAITEDEPSDALRALDEQWDPIQAPDNRDAELSDLVSVPNVFQLRGRIAVDPDHVERLRRVLKDGSPLDRIHAVGVAGKLVIVDGHHRMEAYRQAGWSGPVPVRVLASKPSEAVLQAGIGNTRVRLQMREWERSEAAWRLVKLSASGAAQFSKKQIARAASVSERTVANMRSVSRELAEKFPEAGDLQSLTWFEAQDRLKGLDSPNGPMTDEQVEKMIADFVQRMEKHLGPKFVRNPDIAARALVRLAPRGAIQIAEALRHELADELEAYGEPLSEEEENDDF